MTEEQVKEETHPTFVNPYKGIEKRCPEDWLRISVDVSKSDAARIRSVTMDFGMMQVACAMFVKHLYEYVKRNDLSLDDADHLRQYIVGLTSCEPHGERPDRDDRRGVERVREADKTPKNKSTARQRKQTPQAEQESGGRVTEQPSQDGSGVEGAS